MFVMACAYFGSRDLSPPSSVNFRPVHHVRNTEGATPVGQTC
jgi:hypothetical protein